MCGLSAIISLNNVPPDNERLLAMNSLIKHRGPDGEGVFIDEKVALGHRRLAILDLRPEGDQPMHWNDRYIIVFNGEIYNYIEVGEELTSLGYSFNTTCDTEVILAAYDCWGEACVEKFNGMWAFVLYDLEKQTLFCSRDRLGIKPLYFRLSNDHIALGSEIKQLIDTKPAVNKKILLEFLATGAVNHGDETFFVGVQALSPAHNMTIDIKSGQHQITRYYRISAKQDSNVDEASAMDHWMAEFERSIQYRMRADVRVGTCLSGGLDSSSVAAIAAKRLNTLTGNEKLSAITAVASEKQFDESEFAKAVAEHCGLNWIPVEPTLDEFKKNIEEVIYTQEEPFPGPSIFMQYLVMQAAKENGCKVMLDGQGGDETLLGYEKYYPSVYKDIFKKQGLKELLRAIRGTLKNNQNMSLLWIAKYSITNRFPKFRLWRYKRNSLFIKPHLLKEVTADFLTKTNEFQDDLFELQRYELETSNLPALLRYEDRNSMRHSIEARLPFCDYQTLETSIGIPNRLKSNQGWTKYVLRVAMKDLLPSSVLWRKNKLGFNAPENSWILGCQEHIDKTIMSSNILDAICDKTKLERSLDNMNLRQKWRIFNVAVWESVYHCHLSENE